MFELYRFHEMELTLDLLCKKEEGASMFALAERSFSPMSVSSGDSRDRIFSAGNFRA